MMEEKIRQDLKGAMKEGQKKKVSSLRMLICEINNKKIADRIKEDLDDEKVVSIIQKMVRQHKESIEQFTQGGRDELVAKEKEELGVLEEYMPEQMSEEELASIIDACIREIGATEPKDMGKVMSAVMERVRGRSDGKAVNRIVKEKLS